MKLPVSTGMAALLVLLLAAPSAHSAAVIRRATAATPGALQAAIDSFRADLGGVNNGVGGSFGSGRREINWDGVPDSFALPNNLPFNFFNSNSPRGAVFSTVEGGSALNQFMVSADSDNPTLTPVRFGNFNAAYATNFQAFSAERLFHLRGGDTLTLTFFLPGTNIPASVSGMGVVFVDVDAPPTCACLFLAGRAQAGRGHRGCTEQERVLASSSMTRVNVVPELRSAPATSIWLAARPMAPAPSMPSLSTTSSTVNHAARWMCCCATASSNSRGSRHGQFRPQ